MKQKEYSPLRSVARLVPAAACIVLLFLAASCSQDTDDMLPSDAPDGAVPFTFTAIAPPTMTTRAVDGNDGWKVGDKITVKLVESATGKQSTGTYTITDPKTGAVEVRPGDQPALWQSRSNTSHKVYAWYPAIEAGTQVDITDQSTPDNFRKADLLCAYAENVPYGKPHKLVFTRQMAKVRVELKGIDVSTTDIKVRLCGYGVFILNENGQIEEDYPDTGLMFISACRDVNTENVVAFEALMLPKSSDFLIESDFIQINIGTNVYDFTPAAADRVEFKAGYTYTYRVTLPGSATPTTARRFVLPTAPIVTSFNNK